MPLILSSSTGQFDFRDHPERYIQSALGKTIARSLLEFSSTHKKGPDTHEVYTSEGLQKYPVYAASTKLLNTLVTTARKKDLPVPVHSDIPILSVPQEDSMVSDYGRACIAGYNPFANVAYIPDTAFLGTSRTYSKLGDKIGEEVFGHGFRFNLMKRNGASMLNASQKHMEDPDVEEFYGRLGRRMLLWLLQQYDCAALLFEHENISPYTITEKEIRDIRARMKRQLLSTQEEHHLADLESHIRGYKAADLLDISRLSPDDWKNIYMLPTEKVKDIFFGDKVRYDLL